MRKSRAEKLFADKTDDVKRALRAYPDCETHEWIQAIDAAVAFLSEAAPHKERVLRESYLERRGRPGMQILADLQKELFVDQSAIYNYRQKALDIVLMSALQYGAIEMF